MRIYVDADACPVIRITEKTARKYEIPVTLLCDTSHVLTSADSEIRVVGEGADAVDFALIQLCCRGDIVVTQDYGLAALALGKGAMAIHQSGMWYTQENIDGLLMERHLAGKARRSGKHHLKGPARRGKEDDRRFGERLESMIRTLAFTCRIASREEMERKWTEEIRLHEDDRENWVVWKGRALKNAEKGLSIPYYGFLGNRIICEATAAVRPGAVQDDEGLVGETTAYLYAFRTLESFRGQGYFSRLMRFMQEDLKRRGFRRVTLGVEPGERVNRQIYAHMGFDEFIREGQETYPDGTAISVLYYGKNLEGPQGEG